MRYNLKNNSHQDSSFIPYILIILVCCFGLEQATYGQSHSDKDKNGIVSGGIGIGLGIFYPGDINEYIQDETSNLLMTTGFAEMITNFFFRASLSVRPHQIIELNFFAEYGWAPKFIYVNDSNSYYFSFTRISPGFSPRIHIPIGSGRHSLFFAPGVTYNFMKFKDSQVRGEVAMAHSPGWRAQMGFDLNLRKITLKPYVGYDSARGNDQGTMNLNYSGGQAGIELHF